jgi:uncharacterized integral membrane protein
MQKRQSRVCVVVLSLSFEILDPSSNLTGRPHVVRRKEAGCFYVLASNVWPLFAAIIWPPLMC